jgi:MFS family permease
MPGNRAPLRALQALTVDVSALRESRDLRMLFAGQSISVIGRQITLVAVPYQVYLLTGSSLAVALLGLVQIVPLVGVGLYAGALADLHDRRRVLLLSQILLAPTSLALAVLALSSHTPLWPLYVITALAAGFTALEQPTRQATIPRLVPRRQLASAMSLNQVIFQFGQVAGPVAGGLVIAAAGLRWAYLIDVGTYLLAMVAISLMAPQPPEGVREPLGLAAPLAGIKYVGKRPILLSIFGADLLAMIFGMPRAVFPAMAATIFRVGPSGLGLLYASPAVGALLASLFTGWVTRIQRHGRMVLWSVAVWGAAITAFGLARWFGLALFFLAVAGAADMLSAVFRNTILQLTTEDSYRGRVSSLHVMVITGGPRLGDLETGVVATLVSVPFAVVSGGVACLVGLAVLGVAVPALRRYRYDPLADGQTPAPPTGEGGEP